MKPRKEFTPTTHPIDFVTKAFSILAILLAGIIGFILSYYYAFFKYGDLLAPEDTMLATELLIGTWILFAMSFHFLMLPFFTPLRQRRANDDSPFTIKEKLCLAAIIGSNILALALAIAVPILAFPVFISSHIG